MTEFNYKWITFLFKLLQGIINRSVCDHKNKHCDVTAKEWLKWKNPFGSIIVPAFLFQSSALGIHKCQLSRGYDFTYTLSITTTIWLNLWIVYMAPKYQYSQTTQKSDGMHFSNWWAIMNMIPILRRYDSEFRSILIVVLIKEYIIKQSQNVADVKNSTKHFFYQD